MLLGSRAAAGREGIPPAPRLTAGRAEGGADVGRLRDFELFQRLGWQYKAAARFAF